MKLILYTFLYFGSSLLLGFFSSYFFGVKEYNFPYPIFVSSCQYLCQYLISTSILLFIKIINKYKEDNNNNKQKHIDLICGIISSIDIALSVYSLKSSTLAFYTMIKSSSPVFILLNSFILNIEKPSIKKFIIIFLISGGVFLTTINSNSSKLIIDNNFYIILLASFIGGFRWAFIQYILQKNNSIELNIDPLDEVFKKTNKNIHVLKTIKKLSLPIFIFLFLISIFLEKPQLKVFEACNLRVIFYSCVLSLILIFSEFSLVNISNVMFLSVAGICKEFIIIGYSVLFKNLRFSNLNSFGLFISSIGIFIYSYN